MIMNEATIRIALLYLNELLLYIPDTPDELEDCIEDLKAAVEESRETS